MGCMKSVPSGAAYFFISLFLNMIAVLPQYTPSSLASVPDSAFQVTPVHQVFLHSSCSNEAGSTNANFLYIAENTVLGLSAHQ